MSIRHAGIRARWSLIPSPQELSLFLQGKIGGEFRWRRETEVQQASASSVALYPVTVSQAESGETSWASGSATAGRLLPSKSKPELF
jgi:hypothetical protein